MLLDPKRIIMRSWRGRELPRLKSCKEAAYPRFHQALWIRGREEGRLKFSSPKAPRAQDQSVAEEVCMLPKLPRDQYSIWIYQQDSQVELTIGQKQLRSPESGVTTKTCPLTLKRKSIQTISTTRWPKSKTWRLFRACSEAVPSKCPSRSLRQSGSPGLWPREYTRHSGAQGISGHRASISQLKIREVKSRHSGEVRKLYSRKSRDMRKFSTTFQTSKRTLMTLLETLQAFWR